MEDEKRGYEPPEIVHWLPRVSKDTIDGWGSELAAQTVAEEDEFVEKVGVRMKIENPEVLDYLKEIASQIENKAEREAFLAGAKTLYELLRRQSIADKMNEQLGEK